MGCGRENQEVCRCSIDEDQPLSLEVVECIAEADGGDPASLPPLYEAIDTEALNNLFRGRMTGEITFTYLDYEVTVNSDSVTTTRRLEDQPMTAD